jgi:2-succinyl-6-hydroxy-2,4-cyclohexadiene-1-carboxylate synthase
VPAPPTELVLLHGFTNTGASWDAVVAGLPQTYRPHAPDLRGHGSASGARPVDLDTVVAEIDALAPERFTLVGYSQGGRIALHAALGLPGRIRRLILIGASPGIADPQARAERRRADETLAAWTESVTIEQFVERWAQTGVLADQPPAVRAAVTAERLRNTPDGLAAALRGLGTGTLPSLWDQLGELVIPVELIVGERDGKFRATAERMAAALPDARLHVVPGAGHAVHLEDPWAVAALIVATDTPDAPDAPDPPASDQSS